TPHGLRLRLNATHRAVHHAGTVEHTHRTLHLDGEVDVSRSVDDVETVFREGLIHTLPEAGHRCRGDGDAALLLLHHPVRRGCAIVHLTELMAHAGVEED